ncbi:hypothetical protein [Polymorphum gilvum]|uniref:von Hippel-Lindau disease tumour suppressor beta domain-containing protein n=1 Tax=Polymorphum gilvum (strain LMG 25793 / CGMCC 1.9160 / SL003B-26A1) TaxID=991905 RepID=F2IYE3_POLGS|nr:hypothetical protein [Polymorphum gilvum]ADZ68456.1 hypothetical protein SL003B_0017 [Polymorphum gilvum SL003B-26A1]
MQSTPGRFGPFGCAGAATALLVLSLVAPAAAQTLPQELRISVVPAEPGIRSVLVNRKYRPIVSRGVEGVVVETVTSSVEPGSVTCQVELEVTLENSRVLRSEADICAAGGKLLIDVKSNQGSPGRARVVPLDGSAGETAGQTAGQAPASTPGQTAGRTSGQAAATPPAETRSPVEARPQPADRAAPPQDRAAAPSPQPDPVPEPAPRDLSSIVAEALDRPAAPASDPGSTSGPASSPGPVAGDLRPTQQELPAEAVAERVWSVAGTDLGSPAATLVHGLADTDDVDFTATCVPQSGLATVRLTGRDTAVDRGRNVSVALRADDFYVGYDAAGSDARNRYGQPVPEFAVAMTDPLWDALARKSALEVSLDGGPAYSVSLKGSARPVRLFVATCAEPQQIVETAPAGDLDAAGGQGDVACTEVGRIRSPEGGYRGRILFRNARNEPVDVSWIDYFGMQRHYARLQPGQVLDQETFLSHAWLVTGSGGRCLGVYVSRSPSQEVIVRPPAQPAWGAGPEAVAGAAPVVAEYLCAAGVDLQVTFDHGRQVAVVAEFGRMPVTLPIRSAGPDFLYEEAGYSLAGRIDNATWSRPGLDGVFCARR